jgi:hypothetical protein
MTFERGWGRVASQRLDRWSGVGKAYRPRLLRGCHPMMTMQSSRRKVTLSLLIPSRKP